MVDEERSNQIIRALNSRGVNKPCPRCGNSHFNVVAESSIPMNDNPAVRSTDTNVVPTAIVACTNCGSGSQHALGALGLLPVELALAG